jgi:hypothetical protein
LDTGQEGAVQDGREADGNVAEGAQ